MCHGTKTRTGDRLHNWTETVSPIGVSVSSFHCPETQVLHCKVGKTVVFWGGIRP